MPTSYKKPSHPCINSRQIIPLKDHIGKWSESIDKPLKAIVVIQCSGIRLKIGQTPASLNLTLLPRGEKELEPEFQQFNKWADHLLRKLPRRKLPRLSSSIPQTSGRLISKHPKQMQNWWELNTSQPCPTILFLISAFFCPGSTDPPFFLFLLWTVVFNWRWL